MGGNKGPYLAFNKVLAKSTKDHPIFVGAYNQWLVSKSGKKEAMDVKVIATKIKDKVDELSSSTNSSAKRINELKTSVASVKKASNTAISKLDPLANK